MSIILDNALPLDRCHVQGAAKASRDGFSALTLKSGAKQLALP